MNYTDKIDVKCQMVRHNAFTGFIQQQQQKKHIVYPVAATIFNLFILHLGLVQRQTSGPLCARNNKIHMPQMDTYFAYRERNER